MKNMIKEYGDYLKDNPQGLWFKRKLYGWGWVPAKWQGWAVIGAFLVVLGLITTDFTGQTALGAPSDAQVTAFLIKVGIAALVLIAICYWKGEKPRWQWGTTRP